MGNNKILKIFLESSAKSSYTSYFEKHFHCSFVTRIMDADLVVFQGGVDVDPSIYGEKRGTFTDKPDLIRESICLNMWSTAVKLKKPILGICRGSQYITARSGGSLFQDVTNHTGPHKIEISLDGEKPITEVIATSTHHQMMNPYILPSSEYKVLGWSSVPRSSHYLNGLNVESVLDEYRNPLTKIVYIKSNISALKPFFREPEIVYYPKTNALGMQYHPEYLHASEELVNISNELILRLINGKL